MAKTWIELYKEIFKGDLDLEIIISPEWQKTIKFSFAPNFIPQTITANCITSNKGQVLPIENNIKEHIMREIYLWLELYILFLTYVVKKTC